jgi:hypothetical protein
LLVPFFGRIVSGNLRGSLSGRFVVALRQTDPMMITRAIVLTGF